MENRNTFKQRLLCIVGFEEGWNMKNRNTVKQRLLCMVLKRSGIWKIVKLFSRGYRL